MEFTIRSATIKDLKSIQKLDLLLFKKLSDDFRQTFNYKWPLSEKGEKYFRIRIVNDNYCAYVALINNKVVGYLTGYIQKNEYYRKIPIFAEIDSFFIAQKYRGKKIGQSLYSKFIDWCNTKKIKRIKVCASVKNSGALEFYRKNGFKDYDLILEALI